MKTYIALLRGINVGGKNVLPMKDLVAALESLGARNVRTFIQSGNAVFETEGKDTSRLSNKISAEIKKRRGFEPYILLLEPQDIERVITENPFPEAETDPKALHVCFLTSTPANPDLKTLASFKKESERFSLKDTAFYLYAPEGVGRSKLAANAERLLGAPMTDRNWQTVCKIRDMARELS